MRFQALTQWTKLGSSIEPKRRERIYREWFYAGVLLLCAAAGSLPGKDVNWDQVNYHIYVAHAFVHDRIFLDTFAANIQTYINPIPFLPFYAVVASEIPSAIGSALLGVLHGLSLIAVAKICWLVTRPSQVVHRFAFGIAVVACAAFHPLYVAGLGSSLSEMVAIVPAMWGVYFQLRLCALPDLDTRFERARRDAVLATALITVAFLWKLPMAFLGPAFALALVLPTLWMVRTTAAKLRLISWYGLGAVVGLIAGGVFHYWRVFAETGNPFFPYFNQFFESALYSSHAVVNHRFKTWDWLSVFALPIRMLKNESFVTAEIVAIDPRYLVFLLIMLALLWRALTSWLRGRADERPVAHLTAHTPPDLMRADRPVDWLFIGFLLLGYLAWVLTIGNGRYALPLHLLLPVGILVLTRRLTTRVEFQVAGLTTLAVVQLVANLIAFEPSRWDREPHFGKWVQVEFPEAYKRPSALYVSLAFGDRRSWSEVVPQLHSTSRFINLQGYENTRPDQFIGTKLSERIRLHSGPIYAVLERREFAAGDPSEAWWHTAMGRQLLAYGLSIIDAEACQPIVERPNRAPTPGRPSKRVLAEVCPVARVEAHDFRQAYAAEERAMAALEKRYASILYPPDPAAYLYGALYCKFYTPKEVYVCAENGLIWGKRVAPSHELLFLTKVHP
ncbi:MAG: hypothetical protein LW838_04725 [Nitrosomonadaceae bacterium]|nr:hypothetical protein [Nitrosomonadaceae bacterium]